MDSTRPSLFNRPDTFFGVCEGLGQDLRIHPNILRVALAGLLFWSPAAAIGAYVAAGALVALSRWLVPDLADEAQPAEMAQAAAEGEPRAEERAEKEQVPLAA
jgi:phage shock protein PspC (stress-responsive transcriptional regulator)